MGDTVEAGVSAPVVGGPSTVPAGEPVVHEVVHVIEKDGEAGKRAQAPAASTEASPTYAPGERAPEEVAGLPGMPGARVLNWTVVPLRGAIDPEALRRLSTGLSILSLVTIAIGVVAIGAPLLFSLVLEQFLGVLFVMGGVVQLVHGLQMCGVSAPGCSMNLLLGALNMFVGLWLVTSPIEGLAGLTLLIAAWFFASGISKLVMTYQVRHLSTWPSVLVSGLLSLVLAVLILGAWPSSAAWIIGVLVGVDFLVTGVSLALLACMAHIGRNPVTGAGEPLLQGEQAA